MRISENFEINTYEGFRKHGREAFDIIAETMDLIYKDMVNHNPTFCISNYDYLPDIKNIIGEEIHGS